jgi:probable rRNA maturation factor
MGPMAIETDIQLACNLDELGLEADETTRLIESWVKTTLTFSTIKWCRELPWSYPDPVSQAAQLTVRFVSDKEGLSLNRSYRGGDQATNVLSFPFDEPFLIEPPLLGDVVICVPVLVDQAQQQNKTLQSHCAHLIIHGVLHLLGYDHIDDAQAQVMESCEIAILAELGIADPYGGPGDRF